jgi:hypothetical protein
MGRSVWRWGEEMEMGWDLGFFGEIRRVSGRAFFGETDGGKGVRNLGYTTEILSLASILDEYCLLVSCGCPRALVSLSSVVDAFSSFGLCLEDTDNAFVQASKLHEIPCCVGAS